MKLNSKFAAPRRNPRNGFSLVELVLSLAVLLVITTMAIPVVVRSLQTYQLNATASQLAGMLKFAKFDAIRQNTRVTFMIRPSSGNWNVWVDSNGDGIHNGAEPEMIISGSQTLLVASAAPSPNPILASLGPGGSSLPWMVLSGSDADITFDQRGVLVYPGAATVYALYLGKANDPGSGYRAIITLPSGAVQVWTASSAGDWQRIS
jgi:prepilin-type N-terminal cleavage/methylation domain-containing protein